MSLDHTKELVHRWYMLKADKRLKPEEADNIGAVLVKSKSKVKSQINKLIDIHNLDYFLQVRAQIQSLDIFWRRIILVKKHMDKVRAKGEEFPFNRINIRHFLIGLLIIPDRVHIGLSDGAGWAKEAESVKNLEDLQERRSTRTKDEAKRGRKMGRYKVSRDASSESAARLWLQSASDTESDSETTEDSTSSKSLNFKKAKRRSYATEDSSSSDESVNFKKGERHRRKNVKGRAKPHAENTQRQEQIRKMIEEELKLCPLDDEYWGGRLPKAFTQKFSRLALSPEFEDSPSSSEESTVSSKKTHRGRRTTKASRRQRQHAEKPGSKHDNVSVTTQKRTKQGSSTTGRPRKELRQKTKPKGTRTKDSQATKESAASDNDDTAGKEFEYAAEDLASSCGEWGASKSGRKNTRWGRLGEIMKEMADPLADESSEGKLSKANKKKSAQRRARRKLVPLKPDCSSERGEDKTREEDKTSEADETNEGKWTRTKPLSPKSNPFSKETTEAIGSDDDGIGNQNRSGAWTE